MLRLHRAERTDTLADALAELLSTPLADPFAREVVAVPARGIERWLTQRLSTVLGAVAGDGVAANIAFPSPGRLVDEALSVAAGTTADDDPWHPSRVLWALLDVIDESLGQPWCATLTRHLGHGTDDHRAGRRYATAEHLRDLLRSYGQQRPHMLTDWAAGHDTDGTGAPLDEHLQWQAELWRRLRDRVGVDSPAQRLDEMCERLRVEPDIVDLPDRLSLFGPTRLNRVQLEVLAALGIRRDVHLWLPHASPQMWANLAGREPVLRRADDRSVDLVGHPLLAALARDVRELQGRLSELDAVEEQHDVPAPPDTLLGRLQADVRADRTPETAPAEGRTKGGSQADGTVQIHACHGPTRQVEVLRECLLHLFEDDPTLEPRDVIVMCPDVDTYAPLVAASFGQDIGGHPGHRLRVRLADRGLRRTNPVLSVVAALLGLADARVTASDALDLAASAPVRRMFSFDDDDLERLQEWTAESGARWGLGKRQRSAFGLADFPQNTFGTALDRVLLGVTADGADSEWLALAMPLDDVESNDIDLAGRFAEYIDRLDKALWVLRRPQAAEQWAEALTLALDLLVDVPAADAWQRAQAHREIGAAVEHSGDAELRLADVRAMLAGQLAGRPTRANFRTGELTVCTMVPMRSVPHRVVILLGLDDDVFPRSAHIDGDDVLTQNPRVGERDPRSEDRQLLLDAIMSAGEKVLLFYTGADPVTGAARPPAIPLSEVRDVVATMIGVEDGDVNPAVRHHPLQPFDARNFLPDAPFSFDETALAGARAAQNPASGDAPAVLAHLLLTPPEKQVDIDLTDLVAYLVHPAQGFLRQRLGIRIPELDDGTTDALDIDLDPLARWNLGDRMLEYRLSGVSAADFRAAEWRRGTLPPYALGESALDDVTHAVESLVSACAPVHSGRSTTIDTMVDLGDGRRLTGTVGGVHGNVIARSVFSKLSAKHRITAWVHLLAVAASGHDGRWQAVTTGRGRGRMPAWRSTMIAPDSPHELLLQLVDLRDRGLGAVLPMTTGASAAYAEQRVRGGSIDMALDSAGNEFGGKFGDGKDRHVQYLFGSGVGIGDLVAGEPLADERAWFDDPTRFGVLSRRLWEPLLAAETQGRP
ncbi:exodeoxyribonuclease V subunit gamma [Rhodococcus sp. NPDC060086]|uniref:exodeoxyribonuclease V subunit gamma n=1 Tax=Rhodococcus sp. NPDC060086 TaxID=3347055 RepID=UPI003665E294